MNFPPLDPDAIREDQATRALDRLDSLHRKVAQLSKAFGSAIYQTRDAAKVREASERLIDATREWDRLMAEARVVISQAARGCDPITDAAADATGFPS